MKNDTFLNTIDSEVKSYFIGFFAADGHLEDRGINTRGYTRGRRAWAIKFGLQSQDKLILEIFRDAIDPLAKIGDYVIKDGQGYGVGRIRNTLGIQCWDLGDRLDEMGMSRAKTLRQLHIPIQIPENLVHHFIRGYFDGDGHVSIWNRVRPERGDWESKHCMWNIVSPTREILAEMESKLPVRLKIKDGLAEGNPFFTLYTQGISKVAEIKDYLYKDATVYLPRKRAILNRL